MKKVLIALMFVPAIAFASEDLSKKNGCIACHAVDKKLVGPSFKDISSKYKSKKDGAAYLAGKIRSGGAGVWGPIPMPAQAHVKEEDAKKIADWILTK